MILATQPFSNSTCLTRRGGLTRGVTLIELLCVMAIIAILASLMLPAVFGAFRKVKNMAAEDEASAIIHRLAGEVRRYCESNPKYSFIDKPDLINKCSLSSKCVQMLNAKTTIFSPFSYPDPGNLLVLSVAVGDKNTNYYELTKAEMTPQ